MNQRRESFRERSKVGGAAAIGVLFGLGAFALATQFVPAPYAGLALWLILPGYALAYWWIIPAVRLRDARRFAARRTEQGPRSTYYSAPKAAGSPKHDSPALVERNRMTKEQAREILEDSLSRPTATPAFLENKREELRHCLMDPIAVSAVASPWAQQTLELDALTHPFIAIARDANNRWLLYCEERKTFWKAYGENTGAPLELLGYSSGDALCEWNG